MNVTKITGQTTNRTQFKSKIIAVFIADRFLSRVYNDDININLFGRPMWGGAFSICSLPLTLEPGYASGWLVSISLISRHFGYSAVFRYLVGISVFSRYLGC